jgi:2-polyprenyl-3-methyl-5-hydroxy-6-metoxy-1,4-benzoquinol methylase
MIYTGERFIPGNDEKEIEAEHVHRYHVVAKQLKNKNVLDAGCGAGYGSNILAQYCSKVTAIDISSEAIEWCKENYGSRRNLEFIQASLIKLPFKDSTFDCIVNLEVIEHVQKDIQEAFLKEARRVLKPNGILIISTPNKKVYTDQSGYNNPYHVCEFYPEEFKSFLNQEFSNIRMYNQELYMTSVIVENDSNNEYAQIIKNKNIDDIEKYMIAICSNSKWNIRKIDINSFYKYDNSIIGSLATLYPEDGDNSGVFSEKGKISSPMFPEDNNQFALEFDISHINESKVFRFDPIENQFCICRIDEVVIDGVIKSIQPLNALEYYKEGFAFLNIDPQFKIEGDFNNSKSMTIKGYFKILNSVEISEFVDRLYAKLSETNKN